MGVLNALIRSLQSQVHHPLHLILAPHPSPSPLNFIFLQSNLFNQLVGTTHFCFLFCQLGIIIFWLMFCLSVEFSETDLLGAEGFTWA